MKKIIIAAAFITSALCAPNAAAFDPSALLNALRGDSTATVENSSEKENSSGNSSGGILGALGGFINNTIANNKFTVDDLVGSWSYVSPAVSFQSDNALMKIGGAGAATAVESKLEPYYKTLGFNRMTLTVADDHSFEMKLGILILKGTVEKDDDGNLQFNFSAFKKIPLGKVSANATKAGSTLNLTFDSTRMIDILTKVSGVLNNSTLTALTTLLNSYDGIYMGFKLKKA